MKDYRRQLGLVYLHGARIKLRSPRHRMGLAEVEKLARPFDLIRNFAAFVARGHCHKRNMRSVKDEIILDRQKYMDS